MLGRLRVFLSYSSDDRGRVRPLYDSLSAQGFIDPWIDTEEILPGQDWHEEIQKELESTDVVIVCLSPSAMNKEGVRSEGNPVRTGHSR